MASRGYRQRADIAGRAAATGLKGPCCEPQVQLERGGTRMKSVRTRNVLLATVVLAVMISPFAVAASGPILKLNGRNPTSHSETQIVGRINGTDNNTGGYTTR